MATGSVRRRAQLAWLRPDLTFVELRGNMATRLERAAGEGAGVVAVAALDRLGLTGQIAEVLETGTLLPQVAQGALAVECRADDDEVRRVLGAIDDAVAHRAVTAERAFLAALGGGCTLPVGALATPSGFAADRCPRRGASGAGSRVPRRSPWRACWPAGTGGSCCGDGLPAAIRSSSGGGWPRIFSTTGAGPSTTGARRGGGAVTVYLVGAGPGDPGLLTRRGAEVLARAEVVVFDRLVLPALLELAPPTALLIDMGKSPGETGRQEEIHAVLIEHGPGKTVVRLKGGDPFVFGRGSEEIEALRAAGVDYEVVPGVTSAFAVPAYAGVPVTHRGLSTSVTVVTGHVGDPSAPGGVAWEALARAGRDARDLDGDGEQSRDRPASDGRRSEPPTPPFSSSSGGRRRPSVRCGCASASCPPSSCGHRPPSWSGPWPASISAAAAADPWRVCRWS